jgi:large-conductance mechanosensitive channel
MKLLASSLIASFALTILNGIAYQLEEYGALVPALIQLPFVALVVYLVLVLETKRMEAQRVREEAYSAVMVLLITLITDMAKQAGSQKVTFELIKSVEAYIKAEQALERKEK